MAISSSISASDTDGDSLSYSVTGNPLHGLVVLNPVTGTFTYTPNINYNGTDAFVVTISDGNGGTTTSTVTIGVNPLNDAPVTVADSITVNEGGTATLLESGASSVLANDSDAENSPLSAILVSGPAHGTLTLNANGTFSYTHNGSETTSDSFTYTINDAAGATASAEVARTATARRRVEVSTIGGERHLRGAGFADRVIPVKRALARGWPSGGR